MIWEQCVMCLNPSNVRTWTRVDLWKVCTKWTFLSLNWSSKRDDSPNCRLIQSKSRSTVRAWSVRKNSSTFGGWIKYGMLGMTVLKCDVSESGLVQWWKVRTKGSSSLVKRATSCGCNVALKVMDHISSSGWINKEHCSPGGSQVLWVSWWSWTMDGNDDESRPHPREPVDQVSRCKVSK